MVKFEILQRRALLEARETKDCGTPVGAVVCSAWTSFRHLGVEFVSLRESIDTGSPLGRAVLAIIAAIAQSERLGAAAEDGELLAQTQVFKG